MCASMVFFFMAKKTQIKSCWSKFKMFGQYDPFILDLKPPRGELFKVFG